LEKNFFTRKQGKSSILFIAILFVISTASGQHDSCDLYLTEEPTIENAELYLPSNLKGTELIINGDETDKELFVTRFSKGFLLFAFDKDCKLLTKKELLYDGELNTSLTGENLLGAELKNGEVTMWYRRYSSKNLSKELVKVVLSENKQAPITEIVHIPEEAEYSFFISSVYHNGIFSVISIGNKGVPIQLDILNGIPTIRTVSVDNEAFNFWSRAFRQEGVSSYYLSKAMITTYPESKLIIDTQYKLYQENGNVYILGQRAGDKYAFIKWNLENASIDYYDIQLPEKSSKNFSVSTFTGSEFFFFSIYQKGMLIGNLNKNGLLVKSRFYKRTDLAYEDIQKYGVSKMCLNNQTEDLKYDSETYHNFFPIYHGKFWSSVLNGKTYVWHEKISDGFKINIGRLSNSTSNSISTEQFQFKLNPNDLSIFDIFQENLPNAVPKSIGKRPLNYKEFYIDGIVKGTYLDLNGKKRIRFFNY
jgi:hypothetical protein